MFPWICQTRCLITNIRLELSPQQADISPFTMPIFCELLKPDYQQSTKISNNLTRVGDDQIEFLGLMESRHMGDKQVMILDDLHDFGCSAMIYQPYQRSKWPTPAPTFYVSMISNSQRFKHFNTFLIDLLWNRALHKNNGVKLTLYPWDQGPWLLPVSCLLHWNRGANLPPEHRSLCKPFHHPEKSMYLI